MEEHSSALRSFTSGAAAGLMVDLSLFPLDTLKTRLQSEKGFWNAGGLRGVYKGVGPTILASAPSAAIFFVTYDKSKSLLETNNGRMAPICHMASACVAEIASNLVRVPMEVVKQRRQTTDGIHPLNIIRKAIENEGFLGLYRGFFSTVMRDIPFSIIQFPLWEALKLYWSNRKMREVTAAESALAGAIAGAVAGACTTPLDVAKTRIMLTEHDQAAAKNLQTVNVLKEIYRSKGIQGLFAGFVPRITMIFFGGGIFFGCYEYTKELLRTI